MGSVQRANSSVLLLSCSINTGVPGSPLLSPYSMTTLALHKTTILIITYLSTPKPTINTGTRDMAGPSGLTTEAFVDKVAARLGRYVAKHEDGPIPATMEPIVMNENVDREAVKEIFEKYDLDRTGKLSLEEVEIMLDQMGVAPLIDPTKRSSASSDKTKA